MSGQVAIQKLGDFYRVRFRRNGRRVEWFFGTWKETIIAAGRLMGVGE